MKRMGKKGRNGIGFMSNPHRGGKGVRGKSHLHGSKRGHKR